MKKICKNCGKEIDDYAVVCPYCGVQVGEIRTKKTCTLAIVGFVLSLLFPLVGLICSIIARNKCRRENLDGDGLALAGIIIGAIETGLSLLVIIIYFAAIAAYIGAIGTAALV